MQLSGEGPVAPSTSWSDRTQFCDVDDFIDDFDLDFFSVLRDPEQDSSPVLVSAGKVSPTQTSSPTSAFSSDGDARILAPPKYSMPKPIKQEIESTAAPSALIHAKQGALNRFGTTARTLISQGTHTKLHGNTHNCRADAEGEESPQQSTSVKAEMRPCSSSPPWKQRRMEESDDDAPNKARKLGPPQTSALLSENARFLLLKTPAPAPRGSQCRSMLWLHHRVLSSVTTSAGRPLHFMDDCVRDATARLNFKYLVR